MTNPTRLKLTHRLTAYHWRHNRGPSPTVIGICSCGYQAAFLRRIKYRQYARRIFICLPTGGHRFEYDGDDLWRQCDKCYRCDYLEGNPS